MSDPPITDIQPNACFMRYFFRLSGYFSLILPNTFVFVILMKAIRAISLLLLVLIAGVLHSQCPFYLKDGDTGLPVGDAFVETIMDDGSSLYYVSDGDGRVILEQPEHLEWVSVTHLNYKALQMPFSGPCDKQITLEPTQYDLDAVVVTGQHMPQSLTRSVMRVASISRQEIAKSGAKNLSDILRYQQGVSIERDAAIGSSSLRLGGVGGNNVRVLLNGTPVQGRAGFGFDLDQVNLNDMEKVELVEGPMSVEYGSQALGGVINLITDDRIKRGLRLQAAVHEESAGTAYGLEEGLHHYKLSASGGLNEYMSVSGGIARQYFGGAQLDLKGRAREWDPKTQWMGFAQWDARLGDWRLHYRGDLLDEMIVNAGAPAGIDPPIALDDEYHSRRLLQQLRFGRPIGQSGNINGHLSVNLYNRIKNTFVTNLQDGTRQLAIAADSQDSSFLQGYHTRVQASKLLGNTLSMQAGTDISLERARGGRIEGSGFRQAFDLGAYITAEWKPVHYFTLRPGIRTGYNNRYSTPLVPSLHFAFTLNENWTLRSGYGKGYRAPELRELYFDFFDATHQIRGNPELKAETSDYIEGSVSYSRNIEELSVRATLRSYYHDIQNRIDFVQSSTDPGITTLDNIARLETSAHSFEAHISTDKWLLTGGMSIEGSGARVTSLDETVKWSWSPVFRAGMQYNFLKQDVNVNLHWRWQGKTPVFQYNDESGVIDRLSRDSYHFADLAVHWSGIPNVNLGAGVRNLFNVSKIQTAGTAGGIHSGGDTQYLGYGRSFFITCNYEFNHKKAKE